MEDASFGRQQVGVGRLLHEGVAERVALGGIAPVHDEQLRVDGLMQGGPHLGIGQSADLGENGVGDLATGHGRDLDEPPCRVGRRCQADEQDPAQRLRQGLAPLPAIVDRGDQFLDEERVAVRASGDRIDERGPRLGARDRGHDLLQLVTVEPVQVEPLDAG